MSKTNKQNLEKRFDEDDNVLDHFETDTVINIKRLIKIAPILNISALAREADINVQTLQAKIKRQTPLSGDETKRLVNALKKFHLSTAA